MTPIKCYLVQPTTTTRIHLHRYSSSGACPGPMSFHDAMVPWVDAVATPNMRGSYSYERPGDAPFGQWPTTCSCGYVFTDNDPKQYFTRLLYSRADMPLLLPIPWEAYGPGAMRNCPWMATIKDWTGADGLAIMVKCPPNGREWHIDARASNCSLPDDNVHKCWVRHGEPPNLTVNKDGVTCTAGAGSIQMPDWHGFLEKGYLVENRQDV